MSQLVPSILETSKDAFLRMYAQEVKLPGATRIQVDFGDGIFVPHKMLDIAEIDSLTPAIHWEAHLMVNEPQDFLDYQISGFKTIILHYEAFKNMEDLHQAIATIRSMGMEPVLCLKNETPVAIATEFAKEIDQFQLMSVKPGMQGTPFLPNTYQRIAELRTLLPNAIIEIDGGITLDNAKSLSEAGADLLILGSAITKVPNMPEAWEKIQRSLSMSSSPGEEKS